MDIHTNIPLKNYTTMKLGGPARFMADVRTPDEAIAAYKNAVERSVPVYILGGGSNTIVHDKGFPGLVIRMRIPGFDVIEDTLNDTTIRIGAGEEWDSVVERTVAMRLSGIEAMSAIPGTAGAAPVQNIGAYGQEVADTLVSLDAYDTQADAIVTLSSADCGFSYRHSTFRGDKAGRYIILSTTLKLSKTAPAPPFYDALQRYFDENDVTIFTQSIVRSAVMHIRKDKLPNPAEKPNTGSFFKNAIIEEWQLADLRTKDPTIPIHDMGDGRYKVPAGWLIEHVGLKGKLLHGMRIHDKNALILINESATSYEDLSAARDEIIGEVRDTFRIILEQEPLEM